MRKRSFRGEREFGLIVGGVFALLSAWWIYRGKFSHVAPVSMALGILLLLFGIVLPRFLVYPRKAWMTLAEALSFVSTRLILAIVFFLIVTPIGLIKRLFGWDPLHRRAATSHSYWRPYQQRGPKHYEKMF